ncbi:MAG: DUF2332 family protein [Paracoccaceae bacterium]
MTLADAFLCQARSCEALGSPFMAQLLRLLARDWPEESNLGRTCTNWPDNDLGPDGASLPLRIAGGLHALVLTERSAELAATYPPNTTDKNLLSTTVLAALDEHESFLLDWIQNPPQTNEVRRCAPLIATGHWLAGRFDLPFVVSELGASAGLNLNWDQFALKTDTGTLGPTKACVILNPEWTGTIPAHKELTVADRRGVDLNPLDSRNKDHTLRLLAYLWPDQPHRKTLTRAAIAAQAATVDQGDAIEWLERRLQKIPYGHIHLIYHTIAWQYFPTEVAKRGAEVIEAEGARATLGNPLAWLAMESDGSPDGAALILRLWPGNQTFLLGRVDFHGRWVRWVGPAR